MIFTQQCNKTQRTISAIHPRAWFLATGLFIFSGLTANAECSFSEQGDPPRQIITCTDALTVEKEAATKLQITERTGDAPPRLIQVESGGIFIEVLPGAQPTQIRTPHAIAAVRGTVYAVDVSEDSTAIFVVEGNVVVKKADDDAQVVDLGPGEGVDVKDDDPLQVNVWSAQRAAGLLARFGR